MCLDKVLTDGKITDETTRQLVVNAMIGSAKNDQDILKLKQWFKEEKITNSAGKVLDIKVTVGLKHAFIKRIWSTNEISLADKQSLLDDLEKLDKSDRFEKTQKYCEAAHPDNKQKMWDLYFSKGNELESWGLHAYQQSFMGFAQTQHH